MANFNFNEDHWSRPEGEVVADLVAQGKSEDEARAIVRAVQNAIGIQSDAEAQRDSGGNWERIEAPGAGGPNDPSPNSLRDARRQNAGDNR